MPPPPSVPGAKRCAATRAIRKRCSTSAIVDRERGEFDAAISHYERALLRAPRHPGMLNNLALALEAAGQPERAQTCYQQAVQAQPGHADALANLAGLLHRQQRHREAVARYAQAIAVRSDFSGEFWSARGISLGETGALAEAEASFREAARLQPARAQIHMDIGSVCVIQGKFDAAEVALSRAAELAPGNAYVATMLAFSRMQCCAWDGLEALFAAVQRSVEDETPPSASGAVPFPLLAMPLGPGSSSPPRAAGRKISPPASSPIASAWRRAMRAPRRVCGGLCLIGLS